MRTPIAFALALTAAALVPRTARAADELSVSASLSETRVSVGDTVTLEVNVVSHVEGSIELSVPKVEGLSELGRSKSEGTSIAWSSRGQEITRQYTVTIELSADKAGRFTIPAITARAGGKRAASSPLVLDVGGTEPSAEATGLAVAGRVEPPGANEGRVFLRYKVDRASVYVGQQVLLDLDLYTAPSVALALDENAPPPALDGFWRETVDQPRQLTPRTESVAGRSWRAYRLWRLAVFPLEAGEHTIAPTQLDYSVNRSIFGGGQRERRRAPAVKLEVRPLPAEGRPPTFVSSNVGSYTLSATVDRTVVPAGKAVTLRIALAGRGNVKQARLPELASVPGFRVFPPTVTDSVNVDASGIGGEKRAEILLMPEVGGRLEIPALELVVFDPETERYARLTTASIRVAVEGDPVATGASTAVAAQGMSSPTASGGGPAASAERAELRPLRFRSSLAPRPGAPWTSLLYALSLLGPPLAFFALGLGERAMARARRETPESRRRAAVRHARHRLAKAEQAAKEGDAARAHHELSEALLDFATEKTGLVFRGMTAEEMRRALVVRGAAAPLADGLADEMERASYARFVPGGGDGRTVEQALARAEAVLEQLEGWTPAGGSS